MEGLVESRVERPIPAADLLIDDGPHFPGPSVGGEFRALVADFVREAKADGPMPFLRNMHAGTDVVADPLHALAAALGGKNIEARLEPVGEAVRDLDGFMLGVVGGEHAVTNSF